jgi:cysteine desulfurase family protein
MIYFNNGATSLVKPDIVYEAFIDASKTLSNMGRGVSSLSIQTSRKVYQARQSVAKLFKVENPLNIGFTKNATEALNVAIYGHLKEGDHVVTTVSEHNSVLRPLFRLKEIRNISITLVECDEFGNITPDDIQDAIKSNTSLVVMSHVSNVTGNIFNIKRIGEIVKKSSALFLVDVAQSAGIIDIDVNRDSIDMLAFTGHKYLFSLHGLGGLYVKDGIELEPLLLGGGTFDSTNLTPKPPMPELVEAGTQNISGIICLGVSCDYIIANKEAILIKEQELVDYFLKQIQGIGFLKLLGTKINDKRVALFSFVSDKYDLHDVAEYLDEEHQIIVRTGLQCAPLIHKYIGSGKTGILRVSLAYFNETHEIDKLISALEKFDIE